MATLENVMLMGLAWPQSVIVGAVAGLTLTAFGVGYRGGLKVERRRTRHDAAVMLPDTILPLLPLKQRDALTGLRSRAGFTQIIEEAIKSASPHAVFILDVDRFFDINGAAGHSNADLFLLGIARRLGRLNLQSSWARISTDSFAIVVPGLDSVHAVEALALEILRVFNLPIGTTEREIKCSVSLGVSLIPAHASNVDSCIHATELALRQAKARGGDSWQIHDPRTERAAQHRATLLGQLQSAIINGEVIPFYQPVVDLQTRQIVGLEVLARWKHPEHGLISPDVFIPLAEELQLTGQLTEALMRGVIADARPWPQHLYFAFNVSPGQLRDMIRLVQAPPVWPEGSLDPRRLAIEITESALIEDIDLARDLIRLLQSRGTAVVLDDFGIGFSNFFHLRELPFDRIKIDKSFVLDCADDPRAEACIRAMLAVATSLEIDMVAEGLERPEMAAYLTKLGCRFGQGFLYSAPVPALEVPGLLKATCKPMLRVV